MKVMTLNTHSWLETNAYEKLNKIVEKIVTERYDLIALQEVNQSMDMEILTRNELKTFCEIKTQTPVRSNNFAYCLVQLLAQKGESYYWSWEMSHIGYEIYEEGNAILSKKPLVSQVHTVSETKAKENYRTRKILIGQTKIEDQTIVAASCHFSWWIDDISGFAFEWKQLETYLSNEKYPVFLLGDFNNPAEKSGYDLVAKSILPIIDAYKRAQEKDNQATIEKKIDGWENNTQALRIDYIYVPKDSVVKKYQRIFDGKTSPIVSDHYGIEVTLTYK
ncbi:endonuclease/exonuclease/phosphatase family protein [Enterococcus ratti]|uniref:Endonuclease/exonuclease/phosphatase domain-containing protein n=1 Tax=Enterococcus ratti TaxID=150033 RepID=A0A1L8WLQ3_9ENTE|nr:endonuclease/exonuclease/phosphatase family protein [Enterococcus ratti]OJG81712.1 hypothetical protein RV14_GL000239 [Enterococcus ratti]